MCGGGGGCLCVWGGECLCVGVVVVGVGGWLLFVIGGGGGGIGGPLMGGPQCRLSILGNGNVPCRYV